MLKGSLSFIVLDDRVEAADRVDQNVAFFSVGEGCCGSESVPMLYLRESVGVSITGMNSPLSLISEDRSATTNVRRRVTPLRTTDSGHTAHFVFRLPPF